MVIISRVVAEHSKGDVFDTCKKITIKCMNYFMSYERMRDMSMEVWCRATYAIWEILHGAVTEALRHLLPWKLMDNCAIQYNLKHDAYIYIYTVFSHLFTKIINKTSIFITFSAVLIGNFIFFLK